MVFTLLALFALQRRERARGPSSRASEGGGPAAQHPAALDRRPTQGRDADDRRSVQLGLDPVRRRRGLHAAVGAPAAGRGGRRARPAVQPLRRARRAPRAREDQDDRRLLHGRRGRSVAAARPCPRARPDGARHAGGNALGRRGRTPRARAPRRHQLRPGCGRRDRPEAVPVRPVGRRGEHCESHGVARDARADPDHPGDEGAARGRVRAASRRGTIAVKGKGEMEAWYLIGRRDDVGAAEPRPQPEELSAREVVPGA